MTASSEWHWEQGVKFAVEAVKTALLLNGAAAIALLTFVANAKLGMSGALVGAVALFATGAFFSALAFIAGYLAQLEYGNAKIPGVDEDRIWKKGQRWNTAGLVAVALSVVLFSTGAVVAACAIKSS